MKEDLFEDLTRALAHGFDDVEWTTRKLGHLYNPMRYARAPALKYLETYARERGRKVLFLGMNPGPWGMAQTGVPFGDVVAVRDWMGITGEVGQPEGALKKRPVEGFSLTRREGSGKRLWGWVETRWGTAQAFFGECFVWNYCPLLFLEHTTLRNLTPDRLYKADREQVFPVCDEVLRALVEHLEPEWVVGVGKFAHARAAHALAALPEVRVTQILHPSPASPAANRGWAQKIERQLAAQSIAFEGWAEEAPLHPIILQSGAS